MKNTLLVLLAMAIATCIAVAQPVYEAAQEKMYEQNWDLKNSLPDMNHDVPSMSSCAGPEKKKFEDKDQKCFDKCYEKCYWFVQCDSCGEKHRCDNQCDKCGEKCNAWEYCNSCGHEHYTDMADGKCDQCGGECQWFKQCDK